MNRFLSFLSRHKWKIIITVPVLLVIGTTKAMAVGTGLIFGLYPARRASLLNPIEALRFE